MNEPVWWWAQRKCNEAYKMEPEVTEKVAGEAMKEAGFAEWVDQRGDSQGQSCDIILW